MFGSSNQNQNIPANPQTDTPVQDPGSAGGLSSFTMDPPKHDDTVNPPLPAEPTGSPTVDAPSAPHLDDNPPASADQKDNEDSPTNLPPASDPTGDNSDNAGKEDLLTIKQQALSQLSPLVNHLDQSPEDKFKTLMMMIQANDNQALVKEAYAAAEQITDEKAKSQALLDIVNEINYFISQDKPENSN